MGLLYHYPKYEVCGRRLFLLLNAEWQVPSAPTCTAAHSIPLRAKLICSACYRGHACHSTISLQWHKLSNFPPRTVYQDFVRRLASQGISSTQLLPYTSSTSNEEDGVHRMAFDVS